MSPEQARDYERRWWTLGVLCLSLVMVVVANASLNVALPTLVKDLHASASALQWIVDAYSLVFAGLLLTAGALGDRYGRRLALNGGLLIFGAASGLAAFAGSSGQLIAARAAMGIGAALVMPATLSVLAHVFPPEERKRAVGSWELRTPEPMLDLRFFRNPQFAAATSTITLIFFVMFGMIFILTQYLQSVLGYSPLQAGVRMLPWAVVYMISAPRSARLVERFGQRWVVSTGLGVVAVGLAILSRSGLHANYPVLALSLVVTAAGMGMVTAPSTGAIIASLPLNKAGVGSAVNDTTRELGGALGVAVIGSVLASIYRSDVARHITSLPPSARAARSSLGAALQTAATLPGRDGPALAHAARQAYVHAFDITMLVAVGVALLASGLVSWVLRPSSTVAVEESVAFEP